MCSPRGAALEPPRPAALDLRGTSIVVPQHESPTYEALDDPLPFLTALLLAHGILPVVMLTPGGSGWEPLSLYRNDIWRGWCIY